MTKLYTLMLALFMSVIGVTSVAQTAPPTAYDFVKPSRFSDVELSPSGRYLAYLMVETNKYCFDNDGQMVDLEKGSCGEKYKRYRRTHQIKVYDLQDSKVITSIPVPKNFVIDWLEWASDDRLLGALRSPFTVGLKGKGYATGASRIVSFPRKGGKLTPLFEGKGSMVRQNRYMSRITNLLRTDPDHIIMPANKDGDLDLWKVNVTNGKAKLIEKGRADTFQWFTDNTGAPVLRFDCKNARCRTIKVFAKPNGNEWEEIKTFKRKPYESTDDMDFWPIGPAEKPGQYYMISREDEAARRSIRIYDLNTKSYVKTVYEHEKYDVGGPFLNHQTGDYAGAWYVGDRLTYVLNDEKQQKHIKALNAYFENKENVQIIGYNAGGTQLIMYVSAPNNAGEYYLYDFKARSVERLFRRNTNMPDRLPSKTEILSVPARDGQLITAYHTVSTSRPIANQPLIVMPHGGPEERDNYDYSDWVQYFASRGYQILQVNFRGSSGYGRAFAEAGYGEWGGLMQDDLTDAVKYVHAKGQSSPSSTCIVGYSYGGYAALYGGASTPELYKCIVSGGGLSDIVKDLKRTKVDNGGDSYTFEYWEKSMGSLKTDKDKMDAVSPVRLADQFQAPVLLIHGEYDGIVKIAQSEDMEAALKKAGKSVVFVGLEKAGHNGWSVETEIEFLETVEAFLAKHLKP